MLKQYSRFIYYASLYEKYLGKKLYFAFILSLSAGLSESFGITMLFPLFSSLESGSIDASSPERIGNSMTSIGRIINFVANTTNISDPRVSAILFVIFAFSLKGIFQFFTLSYIAILKGFFLKDIKAKLFDFYSLMDYTYYLKKDTGYFTNLLNEQTNRAVQSFNYFITVGVSLINSFAYLSLALIISWRIGFLSLLLTIGLLYFFRKLNKRVRRFSIKSAELNGSLAKYFIEILQSFKYLRSTNQIHILRIQIRNLIETLATFQTKTGNIEALTKAIREPFIVIFMSILILYQIIILNASITPLLISILLFYRGLSSIITSQRFWINMLEFAGSFEKVERELNDSSIIIKEQENKVNLNSFKSKIEFKNVYFKYENNENYILNDLNLIIPKGHSVAIAGVSGAGKSTIADLITFLIKPNKGNILVDENKSYDINNEFWRSKIGYVSQESIIFNDTIKNNIDLIGITKNNNSPENLNKIKEAAKLAFIDQFIESLPSGYNTLVGDRGIRLSGGQRQRLFIARELFRSPSLLILDEATSSLDVESERKIQKSINFLKGSITLIIITHRLSTIKNVDNIFLIDKGKIVQEGNFEKLSSLKSDLFYKLLKLSN
tara:strand:- start:45 stop:1874 length:1830 start_codon:yes stop_codon:yes gene_type:complete